MSTTNELVARLAEQVAELWNDRHDRTKSSFSRQTFEQFADECAAIAAEARALEQGQGDDLAPPTSHADLLAMGEAMTGGDTSDMIDPTPATAYDDMETVRQALDRIAAHLVVQDEELGQFRALAERAWRKYAVEMRNCSHLEWKLARLAKGPR